MSDYTLKCRLYKISICMFPSICPHFELEAELITPLPLVCYFVMLWKTVEGTVASEAKTSHPPDCYSMSGKTGHPKISVVRSNFWWYVRISGGTFEFPVERSNSEKRVIRKFRWYVEFPVVRSNFRWYVRISGRTFKFRKTGHPKIEVTPSKSYKTI